MKLLLPLLFFPTFLLSTGSTSSMYSFPPKQLTILKDLYDSTHGEGWKWEDDESEFGIPWNFTCLDPNPCLDRWQYLTCSSNCSVAACFVTELSLNGVDLNGTLPQSLGNLSTLTVLTIRENLRLTGSIPSSLGNLKNLLMLSIDVNERLVGTIPNSLGFLSQLQQLSLAQNKLTGTIPNTLIHLTNLTQLLLYGNNLNGTIPAVIGHLANLVDLHLYRNALTGSIPSSIGNLSKLNTLYLFHNHLSGTIPEELGNLLYLRQLYLYENHLSGFIPNTLGHCEGLAFLYIFENSLTGTIPIELGNLSRLLEFGADNNLLTGTIPDSIWNLKHLLYLYLFSNMLTGTLPAVLFRDMNHLNYVGINSNFLSGIIPLSITNLTRLQDLQVATNFLVGTLPEAVVTMVDLQVLNVSNNVLSGSIPNQIAAARKLRSIDVSYNVFSGAIEALFRNMQYLQILFIHNNKLSGPISNLTDSTNQRFLRNVDLSANRFTGSLPLDIWLINNLTTFSAVKNCLHGTLPEAICAATQLRVLALDGLHSSENCVHHIFPGITELLPAYIAPLTLRGSIPSCLFQLPKLTTLHLSGNGLTGSIPAQLTDVLVDLSLSHNQLDGSISIELQKKQWTNLDLSFNKLGGELYSNFSTQSADTKLVLQINRLSGRVPRSIYNLQDINILTGNLFSCNELMKSDTLPINDPDASAYQCGSNAVDISLYSFSATFIFITIVASSLILLLRRSCSNCNGWAEDNNRVITKLSEYYRAVDLFGNATKASTGGAMENNFGYKSNNDASGMSNVILCAFGMRRLRRALVVYTLFASVILFSIYPLLSSSYGQYTSSYGWVVSIVFLSGIIPAVVLLVVLGSLIMGMLILKEKLNFVKDHAVTPLRSTIDQLAEGIEGSNQRSSPQPREDSDQPGPSKNSRQLFGMSYSNRLTIFTEGNAASNPRPIMTYEHLLAALMLWSIVIFIAAIAVNGAYVYALTLDLSTWSVHLLQFAMSIIKLLWTKFVVLDFFSKLVFLRSKVKSPSRELISNAYRLYVSFLIALAVTSAVVAPLVAEALISRSCFYYALTNSPAVTQSYDYRICDDGTITIDVNGIHHIPLCAPGSISTRFIPPFTYSYQCSSQLLVNFVVVYVYRFLFVGVLFPFVLLAIKCVQIRSDQGKSGLYPDSVWFVRLTIMLPKEWNLETREILLRDSSRLELNKTFPRKTCDDNEAISSTDRISIADVEANKESTSANAMEALWDSSSILFQNSELQSNDDLCTRLKLKEQLMVVMATDLSILCILGPLYPPLLVLGCVVVWIRTNILQMLFGRILVLGNKTWEGEESRSTYRKFRSSLLVLNEICEGLYERLLEFVWPMCFLAGTLWSFFLFDILGDAVGALNACWIVFVMISTPFLFYPLQQSALYLYARCSGEIRDSPQQDDPNLVNHANEESKSNAAAENAAVRGVSQLHSEVSSPSLDRKTGQEEEMGHSFVSLLSSGRMTWLFRRTSSENDQTVAEAELSVTHNPMKNSHNIMGDCEEKNEERL